MRVVTSRHTWDRAVMTYVVCVYSEQGNWVASRVKEFVELMVKQWNIVRVERKMYCVYSEQATYDSVMTYVVCIVNTWKMLGVVTIPNTVVRINKRHGARVGIIFPCQTIMTRYISCIDYMCGIYIMYGLYVWHSHTYMYFMYDYVIHTFYVCMTIFINIVYAWYIYDE